MNDHPNILGGKSYVFRTEYRGFRLYQSKAKGMHCGVMGDKIFLAVSAESLLVKIDTYWGATV